MKDKFKLIKKACWYSISSITDPTLKVATQFFANKVMRKCHIHEVPALVVLLAAQCTEGVQFNCAHYLCSEFLTNIREHMTRVRLSIIYGCYYKLCWLHGSYQRIVSFLQ